MTLFLKTSAAALLALMLASLVACNSLIAKPSAANTYTVENRFAGDVQEFPGISIASRAVPSTVIEQKDLTYVRYGKRSLQLDLYRPRASVDGNAAAPGAPERLYPGVVLVHGGGWSMGYRTHLTPMAIALAQAGYVVATISYRLAPEAQYPAAIFDTKAAIRWLRTNAASYQVDPDKIAVGGSSAGGQIASLTGMTNQLQRFDPQARLSSVSSDVQLILNIDGLSDFTSVEARKFEDVPGHSAAAAWFGGSYSERRDLWHDASPTFYVGETSPPVLYLNSAQARFHVGRDQMMAKLAIYGIPCKTVTLPATPHTFWLYDPFIKPAAAEVIAFLDEHFKAR